MFSRLALPLCFMLLVALAPAVEAQVTLKPKFEPGVKYKVRDTSKVSQTLTLGGMPLPSKADNTVVQQYVYRERD